MNALLTCTLAFGNGLAEALRASIWIVRNVLEAFQTPKPNVRIVIESIIVFRCEFRLPNPGLRYTMPLNFRFPVRNALLAPNLAFRPHG